jgi:hypothetical protein
VVAQSEAQQMDLAVEVQRSYFERYRQLLSLLPSQQVLTVDQLQIQAVNGQFPLWQRIPALKDLSDPRQLISTWIGLCAQLLGLGWVGPAFGPNRLTLDGGLCSVEGLQRLEDYPAFGQARSAIELTLADLASGVSAFLVGRWDPRVQEAVRLELFDQCRQQMAQGFLLPPPLAQLVLQRPAFDRIVDEFRLG